MSNTKKFTSVIFSSSLLLDKVRLTPVPFTLKDKIMALEHTFAMIKPDAIAAKNSGKIIDMIEQHGFNILRMHKVHLTKEGAEAFYAVHKEKPFFNELVNFVISGPVIIMALERDNAIKAWRDLMGAVNPAQAAEGTVRKLYGTSIGNNAVHGSDAPETAAYELGLFFGGPAQE